MKTKNFFLVLLTLFPILIFSQDGTLDTSFGDNGVVVQDFYGFNDRSLALCQQNTGKILSIGVIETEFEVLTSSLVRFNNDGTLDNTFGNNGVIHYGLMYYTNINALNNDKLIVGGTIGNWGEKNFLISKLLANGELDTDFGDNGNSIIDFFNDDDFLSQVIIQNDEKIVALGRSKQNSDYLITFVKYLSTGELDTDFGNNGKLSLDINEGYFDSISASLQDDNSIIVSFSENSNPEMKVVKIFKLFENGDLDTSFGVNGIIEIVQNNIFGVSSSLAVDLNNNVLIVVTSEYEFMEYYSTTISRYTASGVLDNSFGTNGVHYFNASFNHQKIMLQANSRILVGGGIPGFESSVLFLSRLLSNGTTDSSYIGNAYILFEYADFILQNDGKILTTGSTYWYDGPTDFVLVRSNNNPLEVIDNTVNGFTIYPNPSNEKFNIVYNFISSKTPYQITDITGKVIKKGNLSGEQTEIDLSNMQTGVYLLYTSGNTFQLIKN